jgi:hypothetical protein
LGLDNYNMGERKRGVGGEVVKDSFCKVLNEVGK